MNSNQRDTRSWASLVRVLVAAATLCWAQVVTAGETITFFHNEVIGSPVVATDVNGFQVWKETYRPYGDQLIDAAASQNNKIGFAGKPFDDSTGLSYMGARYYDPTLGRFMAVDPVSFNFDNLHSFNRYAYANNNPYMYVDPDGEAAVAVTAVGVGVLVVGGGCVAAGSCEKFGRAVWNFGAALNERFGMQLLAAAVMTSGRLFSEATGGDDAPAEGATGENAPADGSSSEQPANTNPYAGPVDEPVIVVDDAGNAIPVNSGEQISTSPSGDYQQVRDSAGNPTGTRLDRGGHRTHSDPAAQGPHGHRPGVTQADENPHLPAKERPQPKNPQ